MQRSAVACGGPNKDEFSAAEARAEEGLIEGREGSLSTPLVIRRLRVTDLRAGSYKNFTRWPVGSIPSLMELNF